VLKFEELWGRALPYQEFVAQSEEHKGLWEGVYRVARIPEWATQSIPAGSRFKLLVLAEDWCGDASNIIPVIARWVAETAGVELRVLRRDENPQVMDRYLTNGSRSIPIVIVLDEQFRELGHWGPRPRALQSWVMANRHSMPKAELYPQIRRWYARDKGQTSICELLELMGLACGRAA